MAALAPTDLQTLLVCSYRLVLYFVTCIYYLLHSFTLFGVDTFNICCCCTYPHVVVVCSVLIQYVQLFNGTHTLFFFFFSHRDVTTCTRQWIFGAWLPVARFLCLLFSRTAPLLPPHPPTPAPPTPPMSLNVACILVAISSCNVTNGDRKTMVVDQNGMSENRRRRQAASASR